MVVGAGGGGGTGVQTWAVLRTSKKGPSSSLRPWSSAITLESSSSRWCGCRMPFPCPMYLLQGKAADHEVGNCSRLSPAADEWEEEERRGPGEERDELVAVGGEGVLHPLPDAGHPPKLGRHGFLTSFTLKTFLAGNSPSGRNRAAASTSPRGTALYIFSVRASASGCRGYFDATPRQDARPSALHLRAQSCHSSVFPSVVASIAMVFRKRLGASPEQKINEGQINSSSLSSSPAHPISFSAGWAAATDGRWSSSCLLLVCPSERTCRWPSMATRWGGEMP